jgi:predicted component of type VI protein secretion system
MRILARWWNSAFLRKTLLGGVAAGTILASAIAFAPVAPAYAQGPGGTPTPAPNVDHAQQYQRLKALFEKEKDLASRLQARLEKGQDVVAKIQKLIDWARQHGIDVSKLQAALDRFKAALLRAQADLDDAKAVLTLHRGFDNSGNVTDPAQARDTVKKAGEDLKDAVQALRGAAGDVKAAVDVIRSQAQGLKGKGSSGAGGSSSSTPSAGTQGTGA